MKNKLSGLFFGNILTLWNYLKSITRTDKLLVSEKPFKILLFEVVYWGIYFHVRFFFIRCEGLFTYLLKITFRLDFNLSLRFCEFSASMLAEVSSPKNFTMEEKLTRNSSAIPSLEATRRKRGNFPPFNFYFILHSKSMRIHFLWHIL